MDSKSKKEMSKIITELEKIRRQEKAVDMIIDGLICQLNLQMHSFSPDPDNAMTLLRLWKIRSNKIIPLIPEILKQLNIHRHFDEKEFERIFSEMKKEVLLEIVKQGLDDDEVSMRLASIDLLPDKIGNDVIPLLIEQYKLEKGENGITVQNSIEYQLMYNMNEEVAEKLIDLLKNYQIRKGKAFHFDPSGESEEEDIPKTIPIFLRKLAEEKDEEYQKSIKQIITDLVTLFEKNIKQLLAKEDLEQLQTLGIIKK